MCITGRKRLFTADLDHNHSHRTPQGMENGNRG